MQFETIIRCSVPRIDCEEHGISTIETPWAEAKNRFTLLFERFAIHVLQNAATQESAKKVLRLNWDEIHRIQERAVERGLKNELMKILNI